MSSVSRRRFLEKGAFGLGVLASAAGQAGPVHEAGASQLGESARDQMTESVSEARGPAIAVSHTVVMREPPKHVPSGTVVDGPILGNGDLGVAMGGPPENQMFYLGKNDFWSQQGSPMSVGGIRLEIPDLLGASYRQEQDLLNAEIRGTFAKEGQELRMRTWVHANENLVVTEMRTSSHMSVTARLFPVPTALVNNDNTVNLGREQGGSGRWYFNGLISDVHVYSRALSSADIGRVCDGEEIEDGLVRRWNFDAQEGKTSVDTPTRMVAGPVCSGPLQTLRPDEWPSTQPSGCVPDGYHLDYQRYAVGKDGRGRAAKLMHSWNYVDAGKIPAVKDVTVAAWIYVFSSGDANFILSKGSWNEAYSLQLDCGRLRFNAGGRFVRSSRALPDHQWVHVAGTFGGKVIRAFVDGKEVIPGARFLYGGVADDMLWITRNADGPLDEQYPWPNPLPPTSTPGTKGREVSFAMRLIGERSTVVDDALHFALESGNPVYMVTSVFSDLDSPHHLDATKTRAAALTVQEVETLNEEHRAWWRAFWSESFVELSDPVVEKFYYASQYILACASREGKVAPGLYGPWVTTDHPSWNGDYTLDYNYQTPVLGLYSSNHIATAGSYEPPIIAFMDRGEKYARTLLNVRGVYYPGHIGPWGMERPFDYDPFMAMKQDAAFSAQPILMRFYSTYDEAYAGRVYPFIRKVGEFWEDYLRFENGRYVIYNDCSDEVGPWGASPDWTSCPQGKVNPMSDLGFVRSVFQGLIEMSTELGLDEERRPQWQHILDHLSPFPTAERDGKTVLLAAENSHTTNFRPWDMEAIWPAGQIGLGTDPKLLETARNSVGGTRFWNHPLLAPALARIGYDPNTILTTLHGIADDHGYPNAYIFFPGGGVESSSTIPAAINEMLVQSHEGILRLFPVWPQDKHARFGNLRAYGAFLVSAEFAGGKVTDLMIESEKGRQCSLENPWPRKAIVLNRNGRRAETLRGTTVTFKTRPRERIVINLR
jgi:hypothetical protein